MTSDWLRRLFSIERPASQFPIPPGLYHAMREAEGDYTRFHLRVERDGTGMLIANATAAARLTPSGVVIVKGLLDGKPEDEILRQLKAYFEGAAEETMRRDVERVQTLIREVITPGDRYPIFNLHDATFSPHEAALIAPLQATLPLTDPDRLLPILDRLWDVGIPHVTFLVSEHPDPAYLLRLVEYAEELGMIAGVRGRALDLWSGTLPADLRQAGVDHLTLLYASPDPAVHDALCGIGDHAAAVQLYTWLEEQSICAVAEMPLVSQTVRSLDPTVDHMGQLGVDSIIFVVYATTDPTLAEQDGALAADALPQVATTVEETANENRMRFIWVPPVQRNHNVSLSEQVRQGPRCAGDVAVRVSPAGEVYPPRGAYRSAGNLLEDSWDKIWQHDAFRVYRERVEAPTRCDRCPGLAICAADCPAEPSGWAQTQ